MSKNEKAVIVRQPVNSSNIKSVGHDRDTNTLEIEFWGKGAIWRYYPVTEDAYKEMVKEKSIGSYFAKNIKQNKDITQKQM